MQLYINRFPDEGRTSWLVKAEDMLEILGRRNGQAQGDDIPMGQQLAGRDFQETIEDVLDALYQQVVGRGRGRRHPAIM